MAICTLIQWLNVADKDVNDPLKYRIIKQHQNVNLPVSGLDLDLEYFVERQPFAVPEYDPRLVILKISNYPVDELDSEFTANRMWITSYEVVERTVDDKKLSVEESESDANVQVFPSKRHLKYLTLYAIISRREALGLNITPAQQEILDKVETKGARLWQNHTVAIDKKSVLDAGNPVDLDSDWELIDPEDEANSQF